MYKISLVDGPKASTANAKVTAPTQKKFPPARHPESPKGAGAGAKAEAKPAAQYTPKE